MRFRRLHLKAVGPFTDVALDLSRGEDGLHIVLGANEAGKSSALRALGHLLFGFPTQNNERFIHEYEQLRVGATLSRRDGDPLEFVRRKAAKNSIRESDDATAIPQAALDRFLGGLDRSAFETMFGIDHDRLRKAGEDIREGKGHFGEMLFASGAGLAGLRQVQKSLQDRIDDLFKPQGKNPKINQGIAEYKASVAEIKKRQLSKEEWKRHDEAFRTATAEAKRLSDRVGAIRREERRLTRLRDAIPLVARRARLLREREALGDVVRLRDDFGREAGEAVDALRLAERAGEQARHALEELDRRIVDQVLPESLLDAAKEIDALQERLGAIEKAKVDRVRVDGFRQDAEHRARELLRDLGRPAVLEEAERALLRADEPAAIRALGEQRAELRGQADQAKKTIARQEKSIARQAGELAELPVAQNVEVLRRLVRSAQKKAGDIDDRLAKARELRDNAEENAANALCRLPLWSGSAQELARLAPPLDAAILRLETEFQESARARKSLDERVAAQDEAIRDWRAKLSALEQEGDVPSEDDLSAARRRRDDGWRLIRAAWLEKDARTEPLEAFRAEFPSSRTPAEAFEQSVLRADELADRLRREADRVGRKSEASAQLARQEAAREAIARDAERLAERRAEGEKEWEGLVASLGVLARAPAELRGWLRARDTVVQFIEKAHESRRDLKSLETLADEHRDAIRDAFGDLGETPLPADRRLSDWLEHAGSLIDRADKLVKQRENLENKLQAARDELADARSSFETAEADLDDWRARWALKMTDIGLEADAEPAQAAVFLDKIQELDGVMVKQRSEASRVKGIDRDAELFREAVETLVRRVAPALVELSVAEQARELSRLLKEARDLSVARAGHLKQRDREADKLRKADQERDAARDRLDRLCRESGRDDPAELAEAERRSADFARIEKDLLDCESEIDHFADPAGEERSTFVAEVESANVDRLAAALEPLEKEIAEGEGRLIELNQTIGTEREGIDRMEGGDDRAAAESEKAQTILATLRADVERYAVVKLAALALRRGIERHREKNQGPVLERAGKLFADLTGRSFLDLQIDEDDDGGIVLKGIRDNGRSIGVEAMSDGTHDQLALALRLAGLEIWLKSHEPIPFVVDDILLNFDNARATAALKALAELSQSTQVLFFTHHRHVVDLARSHLSDDLFFVHELPAPNVGRIAVSPSVAIGS